MNNRAVLAQLTACLRGECPVVTDWAPVLVLANRALVTAQLYGAIVQAGAAHHLPDDARTFLREVFERNRERNRRLSEQLADALGALNGVGIEPLLLKGAAVWASSGCGMEFNRILSDIDFVVKPSEVEQALSALERSGFSCEKRISRNDSHAVALLGRPTDVGFIDLHQRPPGPFGIAQVQDIDSFCTPTSWLGSRARVPAPALQILFLVLHDQFHDGDYWRGGFDLRHLMDIAELSRAPQSVDWLLLDELCRTSLVRNVLGTQLMAAQRLVGALVPPNFAGRRWVRFQHQRHMLQFAYPRLSRPLALVGVLTEWPSLLAHRAVNDSRRHQALGPKTAARRTMLGRALYRVASRMRRFRRFLSPRAGKL